MAGFSKEVEAVENGRCPSCGKDVSLDLFDDALSREEFKISGLCALCQTKVFGNYDGDGNVTLRYVAQDDEFVTEDYQMFSGQGEAVRNKYYKYVGKSGNTWLVADSDHAAENVYVTDSPRNNGTRGFGGATLKMELVDGGIFELHGGWHGNAGAFFDDTGIDIRNQYRTFVVLAKEREGTNDGTYRTVFRGIVYKDDKPTLGNFDRYKDLIKQYPEAKYYYSCSRGGSSSGPV